MPRRVRYRSADFWDEAEQATATLRREGVTVPSAAGSPKAHPAVAIARSARLGFAAMVKALDLDGDDIPANIPGSRNHHGKGYYA
jgi:hypothetical protein